MNRRDILRGLIALPVAAAAAPVIVATPPILLLSPTGIKTTTYNPQEYADAVMKQMWDMYGFKPQPFKIHSGPFNV